MSDISVIILTGKEELHIKRCLEKLAPLEPKQVFVVESQKGDRTHDVASETAKELGWQVKAEGEEGNTSAVHLLSRPTLFLSWHDYPGYQAAQFNWALDNLKIVSSWVLRLDADEYLYPETAEEIKQVMTNVPEDVTAFSMLRRCTFGGKLINHGGKVVLVRLFRFGRGRSETNEMDEHIVTDGGRTVMLKGLFVDDNLNGFEAWKRKHLNYAEREARQAMDPVKVAQMKRGKRLYYKFPPYFRAVFFWALRYFAKLGFLDGRAGWRWNFWQGLWYRWQVDREIARLRRAGVRG